MNQTIRNVPRTTKRKKEKNKQTKKNDGRLMHNKYKWWLKFYLHYVLSFWPQMRRHTQQNVIPSIHECNFFSLSFFWENTIFVSHSCLYKCQTIELSCLFTIQYVFNVIYMISKRFFFIYTLLLLSAR